MWIYAVTLVILVLSFSADHRKTGQALRKALSTAGGILPSMMGILLLVACAVVLVPAHVLSHWVGPESGLGGAFLSSIAGAFLLIPGFVALPMAKALMENGAGAAQMAVFLSTLMMVGVLCLPMEKEVFGWKLAISRNILAYLSSFSVGLAIWLVTG
jgi:uncharacterized membrane protein YraQ (UPF0718 family)